MYVRERTYTKKKRTSVDERWRLCVLERHLFSLCQCVPALSYTRLHHLCYVYVLLWWSHFFYVHSVLDGFVWLTNTNNTPSNDNPPAKKCNGIEIKRMIRSGYGAKRERKEDKKKCCASLRINYRALGIIHMQTAAFFPYSPNNNWILSVPFYIIMPESNSHSYKRFSRVRFFFAAPFVRLFVHSRVARSIFIINQ